MGNTIQEVIEQRESSCDVWLGYIFRCDDVNRPDGFKPDTYYRLWEFEKVSDTVKLFESLNLNYDLVIEEYNRNDDTIAYHMNLKVDNWRNDAMVLS